MRAPYAPGYLQLTDSDGIRHVIRISAIQLLSDADACQDSSILVVAGRSLSVPIPLDRLLSSIEESTSSAASSRVRRRPASRPGERGL